MTFDIHIYKQALKITTHQHTETKPFLGEDFIALLFCFFFRGLLPHFDADIALRVNDRRKGVQIKGAKETAEKANKQERRLGVAFKANLMFLA
jgi:hypothetical protein